MHDCCSRYWKAGAGCGNPSPKAGSVVYVKGGCRLEASAPPVGPAEPGKRGGCEQILHDISGEYCTHSVPPRFVNSSIFNVNPTSEAQL